MDTDRLGSVSWDQGQIQAPAAKEGQLRSGMSPNYFRADKRLFNPGDTITTAGEFLKLHLPRGKRVEELLERTRPACKPRRTDCLMLFELQHCAEQHWIKMSGGLLYSVSLGDGSPLHRGDMRLVNAIDAVIETSFDEAEALSNRYWSGATTPDPCVEVLASAGIILSMVGSNEQRVGRFRQMLFGT